VAEGLWLWTDPWRGEQPFAAGCPKPWNAIPRASVLASYNHALEGPMPDIKQAKILIMATDGFEQAELLVPQENPQVAATNNAVGRAARLWSLSVHLRQGRSVRSGSRTAFAKANAIHEQALHHTLDVVARLEKRDALDPVDRVDTRQTRVAVCLDPL
jgi:hypothetical protein